MFATVPVNAMLEQLFMNNTKTTKKINLICVNASFRTAELLWLCKSIETSTLFMEQKI